LDGGRLYLGTDDGELVAIDLETGEDAWRARLGTLVRSSPLVASGRVFVGLVDKAGGGVAGLDAESGKRALGPDLGARFSCPASAPGRVLVGSDDGSLHAVDAGKGGLVWSHKLGGRVRATPAVSGDRVVVGDFEGRLAAVKLEDGQRLWLRELGAPLY